MPDIRINHALMATLTPLERREWAATSPGDGTSTAVFRYNDATEQVGFCIISPLLLLYNQVSLHEIARTLLRTHIVCLTRDVAVHRPETMMF